MSADAAIETPELLKTRKVQAPILRFFRLQSSASRLAQTSVAAIRSQSSELPSTTSSAPPQRPVVDDDVLVVAVEQELPSSQRHQEQQRQHVEQSQLQQQQQSDFVRYGGYVRTPDSTAHADTLFAVSVSNEDEQLQQMQQHLKRNDANADDADDGAAEKPRKSKRHVVKTRLTVPILQFLRQLHSVLTLSIRCSIWR
jgi:arylamine N-acetyltransferase